MSLCANTVQANDHSYFFALSGAGAGTAIQSPASVIPDGTGTATLAVQANQSTGSAAVAVVGGATSTGVITVGGYGQTYRMGVLAASVSPLPSLPNLQIGVNSAAAPAIDYDPGVGSLQLGDGNATGVVQTNNALFVSDPLGGANKLGMSPASAATSVINQTVATNGVIFVGSSAAAPQVMAITDAGANAGAVIVGGNGGNGVKLVGGAGSGPPSINANVASAGTLLLGSSTAYDATIQVTDNGTQAYVIVGGNGANGVYLNGAAGNTTIVGTTAVTDTNGNLQLQASTGATNTVNITDTTVTIDQVLTQQVPGTVTYQPAVPLGLATRGVGNYDFSIGTYATGLYMLMLRVGNASLTDNPTTGNMFSTLLYIQQQTTPGTSIVVGGGGGGSPALYSTPIVTGSLGADSIRIVNNTGSNTYFSVKMLQIMGTLPGFNA